MLERTTVRAAWLLQAADVTRAHMGHVSATLSLLPPPPSLKNSGFQKELTNERIVIITHGPKRMFRTVSAETDPFAISSHQHLESPHHARLQRMAGSPGVLSPAHIHIPHLISAQGGLLTDGAKKTGLQFGEK